MQAQVLPGRVMQLATSLAAAGGKLVLKGALVLPNYACLNSAKGWVGFGLPPEQGGGLDMVGGQVFITQPVTCQPGATSCTGGWVGPWLTGEGRPQLQATHAAVHLLPPCRLACQAPAP